MSTFRKTVLTTAIVGAGLAATTGSAFATEGGHHGHESHKAEHSKSVSGSCINAADADINNGGVKNIGALLNGNQNAAGLNACNILNGNKLLSGNNIAGGDIHNGNTKTVTSASSTGDKSPATILTGLL